MTCCNHRPAVKDTPCVSDVETQAVHDHSGGCGDHQHGHDCASLTAQLNSRHSVTNSHNEINDTIEDDQDEDRRRARNDSIADSTKDDDIPLKPHASNPLLES